MRSYQRKSIIRYLDKIRALVLGDEVRQTTKSPGRMANIARMNAAKASKAKQRKVDALRAELAQMEIDLKKSGE